MKLTVAVAISGGVDSLVAARLLKEKGHQVIGIHFTTGYESSKPIVPGPAGPGTGQDDPHTRMAHLAIQLGIPIHVVDMHHAFDAGVIKYFTRAYQNGQTPNPCLVCNRLIKFGCLLETARGLGAFALATGHYARRQQLADGSYRLLKGVDLKKDQSYFLAFLNQQQLRHARFPLGCMTKSEVKIFARQNGLHAAFTAESQDVCFVSSRGYADFLARQADFKSQPGLIEDTEGNILGEHQGLHLFTIGQRRGINCPAAQPYYVVRLDKQRNRLVVGFKPHLQSAACRISNVNWIGPVPAEPIRVHTRLRYRHQEVPATLSPKDRHTAIVRFEQPQMAVTPGQGAVFYRDDEVLGGGWIDSQDTQQMIPEPDQPKPRMPQSAKEPIEGVACNRFF